VTIGGGVVGLSVALALQSRGIAVTVFDAPGERPPASWGNAGHIATEQSEPLASWGAILSLPRRLAAFGGPVSFPRREICLSACASSSQPVRRGSGPASAP
jgi:D-hydroxyproline dehydrogenase